MTDELGMSEKAESAEPNPFGLDFAGLGCSHCSPGPTGKGGVAGETEEGTRGSHRTDEDEGLGPGS